MATEPDRDFANLLKVLIVSGDEPGGGAGTAAVKDGPAWSLAETLAPGHDVILAVPRVSGISHPLFAVVFYNARNIGLLARDSDVVIIYRSAFAAHPGLADAGRLEAAAETAISAGRFMGRAVLKKTDILAGLGPEELLVLYPAAPEGAPQGVSHYFNRLRFHLRHSGARQTASRGTTLIKRKIRGGKKI